LNRSPLATIVLIAVGCVGADGGRDASRGNEPVATGQLVADTVLGGPTRSGGGIAGSNEQIAVGPTGDVFIAHANPPSVQWYGRNGDFKGVIGRRGRGPGEYVAPTGVVVSDDMVVVHDPTLGRLLYFDAVTGRFAKASAVPVLPGGSGLLESLIPAGDGSILVYHMKRLPPDKAVAQHTSHTSYLLVSTAGGIVDTLEDPRNGITWPEAVAQGGSPPLRPGCSRRFLLPFAPREYVAWAPGTGFVRGDGAEPVLRIQPPHARTVTDTVTLRVPGWSRAALLEAESEWWRARIVRDLKQCDAAWKLGADQWPTTKPYFGRIVVGRDGRYWLNWRTTGIADGSNGWRERNIYAVFETSGNHVGVVDTGNGRLLAAAGDTLWTKSEDDDGFTLIARYVVRW
jgi:hypothetical protein